MTENGTKTAFADLDLEEKVARNDERIRGHATRGVQIEVSSIRIGTMLEVLLGERLDEAEELIQDRLAAALDQVDLQVAQADAAQAAERLGVGRGMKGITGS